MKTLTIFSICFLLCLRTHAQTNTTVMWDTLIGGTTVDALTSIEESPIDTSIVLIGYTKSTSFAGFQGNFDIMLVKTTKSGVTIFQHVYGTAHEEFSYKAKVLPNGDIVIVGGITPTFGVPLQPDFWGLGDIVVMKISRTGTLLWQKYYGGGQNDLAYDVIVNTDGNLVVVGETTSFDGDFISCVSHGNIDSFVLVLDAVDGNVISRHLFGGSHQDRLLGVIQSTTGMYYFAGWTISNNGDVSGNHGTMTSDGWVFCLDQNFSLVWQKCIGTTTNESFWSIVEGSNGMLFLSGKAEQTSPTNGDITSYKGNKDGLIVSMTPTGTLLWTQTYGGTSDDYELFLKKNSTGGVYAFGLTNSNNLQVLGNAGSDDSWVFSFDDNGSILSTTMVGKPGHDNICDILLLDTTNFVGVGQYTANNMSIPWDAYVVSTTTDFRIKNPPPVVTTDRLSEKGEVHPLIWGTPTRDSFFLVLPKKDIQCDVHIYTMSGSLVLIESDVVESMHRVDVSALASGVYMIHITTNSEVFTQKIQKL